MRSAAFADSFCNCENRLTAVEIATLPRRRGFLRRDPYRLGAGASNASVYAFAPVLTLRNNSATPKMLSREELNRLSAKIAAAEQLTSADLCVVITKSSWLGIKNKAR